MPDPARIAQAQVLEIPVTIQGEKAVDETGLREPFAESAKTALTFDNGAVVKLQARVKAGESVSLRNEQSGKEIRCTVLEAPAEGQLGYTDLEFVESVPDFWEGHAEQAGAAGEKPEAGAAKSDGESAVEEPEPGATAAEPEAIAVPEGAPSVEPAAEAESPAAQEDAPDADVSGRTQRGENQTARDSAPFLRQGGQDDGDTKKPEPPEGVAAEPERAAKAEPAVEKHVSAKSKAAALVAEAVAALEAVGTAQAGAHAPQETEAAADNSLAMMSATASEVKLPPVQAPAPEEKPEEQKPQLQKPEVLKHQGRLREELVPAHEMVPQAQSTLVATAAPPAPSPTDPTGEQIDAALRSMEGGADPNDAKDKANLAALMERETRLAKYAALKEKAASQIGRGLGPAPQSASKGAEVAAGEAGASVEGEVEIAPPKVPLSERLTTGRNAVIVEIVAGVAIVVALGFIWHAVRGVFIHPKYRQAAVAAARPKKAAPPNALAVVVQTPGTPVAKMPAATPTVVTGVSVAKAPTPAAAAKATVATSAAIGNAPAAKATAARPTVVASAPAAKIVQPSAAHSESAEDDGPRVVEPPPASEEPEPVAAVAPKAAENIPAKIVSAPQPGFPSWAKKLDVGSVVRLDAVIDEKGNLEQTKIVSGPRLLERAAQQAVQLWIFEPAQLNGKPAATHMVLTVEFQR